jgi:hypothetical protein
LHGVDESFEGSKKKRRRRMRRRRRKRDEGPFWGAAVVRLTHNGTVRGLAVLPIPPGGSQTRAREEEGEKEEKDRTLKEKEESRQDDKTTRRQDQKKKGYVFLLVKKRTWSRYNQVACIVHSVRVELCVSINSAALSLLKILDRSGF